MISSRSGTRSVRAQLCVFCPLASLNTASLVAAHGARVVDQHRNSKKLLTQTEIARRWRGEVALDELDTPSRRLVMLGRDPVVDGAPCADGIPDTLEARTNRVQAMDAWNVDHVFWDLCHDRVTRTAAVVDAHATEFSMAVAFHTRFQVLATAMHERNVSIRSDSRMCAQYVDGTLGLDAVDVVDVMEEMAWLFSTSDLTHYPATREDCFEEELRQARDMDGWLSREEMCEIGDLASDSAKARIAYTLARKPDLAGRVAPVPRLMAQRIESHEHEAAKEREQRMERRCALEAVFRTGTLCELAFTHLIARQLVLVPPNVLDAHFDRWFESRERASVALKTPHARAMDNELAECVRRASKIAITECHGQWVPVGPVRGKYIAAMCSIARWLGLGIKEAKSDHKKAKDVSIRCESETPFASLVCESWCEAMCR